MSKLRVTFGDPEHGWMAVTIQHGEQETMFLSSDVCYSSLCELTLALFRLLSVEGEQVVTWMCEPREYDTVFARDGDVIGLRILSFPDSHRSHLENRRSSVLTEQGEYGDVCLPFWRALRSLQGRFTEAELSGRWRGFPHCELNLLTEALGKAS